MTNAEGQATAWFITQKVVTLPLLLV